MPRTKASRRSAVAKKRMADQRGGPGDPAVALTDEVMPLPSPKKVLTDCGPVSYSPPLRRASARSAASVTDGVTPYPHDEKALSDGSMPFAHNKKVHDKIVPFGTCEIYKTSDETSDKTSDKTSENTSDKTSEKTSENTSEKTSENTSEKTFGSSSVCCENAVNFTVSFEHPQALAVRGSFHQAHPRFGCNSNKQCVANSVTSIMTAKVKNVLTWTMRDLDDVLLNGDRFYSSIRDAGRIHDPSGYLFVQDLPTEYALHGYEFELSYSEEMFTGLFGVHEYGDMQDVFMSHDVALRTVLTRFDACLFTVKVNTCAIVKRSSWYVVIDSHARNLHGEVDEESGKSLVAYHANIESLLSHITILGLSLQAEQEQFEVTGVTVNVRGRSAMQQHGNASGVCLVDTAVTGLMESCVHSAVNVNNTPPLYSDAVRRTYKPTDSERKSKVCSGEQNMNRMRERPVNTEGDVILVGQTQGEVFQFNPLKVQEQKRLCLKLNIPYSEHDHRGVASPVLMGDPCKTQAIRGDGNCFFRALAFSVSGSESDHRKIRRAVTAHMEKNESRYRNYLRQEFISVANYVATSRMKYVGTWATEVEIQAAADFLGVDVFTYTQNRWLKYSACNSFSQETGIYLQHSGECHYEVVTCVKVHHADTCAALCLHDRYLQKSQSTSSRYETQKRKTRYETNQEKRDEKIHKMLKRYHDDEMYRDGVKMRSSVEYTSNLQYREQKKQFSINKYATDTEHREHVKQFSMNKYATDIEHREHVKQSSINKYATNVEHRQQVKQSSVNKYATNESHRDALKRQSFEDYHINVTHQAAKKQRSVEIYHSDPIHQAAKKQRSFESYHSDPIQQAAKKQRSFESYHSDPIHQAAKKQRSFECYHSDPIHQAGKKQSSNQRYKTDSSYANATKMRNKERKNAEKKKEKDINYVIEGFRQKTSTGPEYVCSVCHRLLFKHQVIKCRKDEYLKKEQMVASVAEKCITDTYLHLCDNTCIHECNKKTGPAGTLWICYTCHRKILNGKMPEESVVNTLTLDPIPPALQNLNSLEQHLIGMNIPFMRLMSLPKGGQNGVHGPVVCVPSNITDVTETLPRSENVDLMIRIKLKRKLTYKGHYEYKFVNPDKVKNALLYLKEHNPFYRDVQFNNDWVNPLSKIEEETIEQDDACMQNDEVNTEENNEAEDVNIDETLHDRQQHGMFMDTCLQPVDVAQEMLDQHFDGIMSVAPAEGNNPIRLLNDESNEAKCFPVLFPKGTGTFHEPRKEKLTLARYLNTRILSADGRFAKNLDYIFYGQYLSELNQIVSNVSIALRKGYDGRNRHGVTSEMLRNKDAVQEILNYDEGYKFLRPVRGTPAFWQNVQKDLFAMVRQLGIPTWFCSFSSADLRWPELMESILRQEGRDTSPDELDWSERCGLLKINPVTAARMFDHRFRCFLKDVIMSEAQPIGKIVDYFYRVEFQQRGSPHVHCLFWVEDAPQVDKNDDDEVVAFVDRFVTCEMPSEDDTEIYEIVSGVQRHSKRHSKSCKKRGTPCRFNFPRPPSSRTFITRRKTETGKDDGKGDSPEHSMNVNDIIDRELAEAIVKKVKDILLDPEANFQSADDLFASMGINQDLFEAAYIRSTKKTTFVLKRKPCDVWVNQYNRELLRCWNANMDIQFVVDAYSCIVYIISYISKAEREMGLLLSRTQKEATEQGNLDAKQALRKLGSVFLHNREVSAQESVYRLTNMTLKEASRKVQFIPTGENVVRMSLPLHIIQTRAEYDDNDNQNIWMNSITDRYKCRPETEQFSEMCLARFVSEYRILSKSESSSRDAIKLEKGLGHVRKRTRTDAAVVRYARFSPTKHPEKHYQSILQLFLPHYMDCELKPSAFNTYEDFYKTGFVTYSDELCSVKYVVDFNMSCFEKDADTIDEAEEILKRNGVMEDAWAQICPESEQERLECVDMKKNETTERQNSNSAGDIPDLLPTEPRSSMRKEEAMNVLRSLNEEQSEIFYKIRDWCLQKTLGANPEPFRVFISGPGGVGKSMLIKAIYYESSRILSRLNPDNPDETHVLLTAPTGVSAFNIDAATIHNCFSIGTDVKLPYQPLGDEKINSLRAKMGNLQIVIIDEISMVDHKLLAYVHGRLRQIKQPGDYSAFGNVSVIAVGDFYQLAPVKGKSLYTEPKGVNLWQNHFALAELTCIMRQKDMEFAQLLSRLRKRKIHDKLLDEDLTMLKQCEAGDELDGTALYIHATNAEVDLHNTNMLKKLCSNNITIHAKDFERVAKTGRLEKMDGHHVHISHTSLPESLHIGVNARVMLVKNIDVADGLVNGAFGSVTEICFDADDDFPSKIYVTFENERTGKNVRAKNLCLKPGLEKATPIKPEEERVTKSGGMRRQFPLKLAWACTVHKVQGLTVEKCVVSLKNIFAAGQAYVALSRVTSLEGLKIKDFKESAIYSKQDIELSLQSMPQFTEPVKELLPSSSSCKILLHNIEGLMSHVEDLRHDKRYMKADIICMTETWLKSNYCIDDIQLCEFSFHSKPRSLSYDRSQAMFAELKEQQHGGVGMYYKQHTNCTVLDLACTNMECLFFVIPKLNTTAAVVYRPPSYNMTMFENNLINVISHIDSFSGGKIIMGDFNENLFVTNRINNIMELHGFTQVVKEATTENGTLIDHIYIKDICSDNIRISVMSTYFSCHECVVLNYFF